MATNKTGKKGGNGAAGVIIDILKNTDPEDLKKGIETAGAIIGGVASLFKKKKPKD